MSGNFRKTDLRVVKTRQALVNSMESLLGQKNFGKISVNDLCEKALVSRATFYIHFNDKYGLLRYWMESTRKALFRDIKNYEEIESGVNQFIHENANIIINLVENADNEILDLLHDFMYAIIDTAVISKMGGEPSPNQILVTHFCAGGMVSLLKWQVQNRFPKDMQMINECFYQVLRRATDWDSER